MRRRYILSRQKRSFRRQFGTRYNSCDEVLVEYVKMDTLEARRIACANTKMEFRSGHTQLRANQKRLGAQTPKCHRP